MTATDPRGGSLHVEFVTLFPEMVTPYFGLSVLGRAQRSGLMTVGATNPRDFAADKHRTVDDHPFGGGAGLLMKPEPLALAIEHVREARAPDRVVLLGPSGRRFDQSVAEEYAQLGSLAFVCGRYEGVDERVAEHCVDEELSLGDFVLTGGEVAAMAIADAVARLRPGVLGHPEGALDESFAGAALLEHPQYTRPAMWRGLAAPPVLLSGDHGAVAAWRHAQRLERTRVRRPDLWTRYTNTAAADRADRPQAPTERGEKP